MNAHLEHLQKANAELKDKSPQEILAWTLQTFKEEVVFMSSFSFEDIAIIDMGLKIDPRMKIATLDTGRLHEETYELMERIRFKYNVPIHVYFPDAKKVEALEKAKGFYSFRDSIENRKECCGIRKVEPLSRALVGNKAWINGRRRDQAVTRTEMNVIEWDDAHQMAKVSPLASWTEEQARDYVRSNKLPYNKLFDQGYRSIGCAPCTRAVKPGEDERAGRWWWERPDQKECGIHQR